MSKVIYGIDTSKKINAKDVRDAIIVCFTNAHESIGDEIEEYNVASKEKDADKLRKTYSENIVRKFFEEIGADYENPTKKDLIKLCDKLAEFSKNFRDKKVVKKHYSEIMELVNKLE